MPPSPPALLLARCAPALQNAPAQRFAFRLSSRSLLGMCFFFDFWLEITCDGEKPGVRNVIFLKWKEVRSSLPRAKGSEFRRFAGRSCPRHKVWLTVGRCEGRVPSLLQPTCAALDFVFLLLAAHVLRPLASARETRKR